MSCQKGLFDKTLFDQALYGAAVIVAVFALFNPSQFQAQPFDTEQVCTESGQINYYPPRRGNASPVYIHHIKGRSDGVSRAGSPVIGHRATSASSAASSSARARILGDLSALHAENETIAVAWMSLS